jgi:hypothetical protein
MYTYIYIYTILVVKNLVLILPNIDHITRPSVGRREDDRWHLAIISLRGHRHGCADSPGITTRRH